MFDLSLPIAIGISKGEVRPNERFAQSVSDGILVPFLIVQLAQSLT